MSQSNNQSTNPTERIGFIGLGAMGVGMASNILKNGYTLSVMGNSRREPVDRLISEGAVEVNSPKEMAQQSDIVVICVTTSDVVEQLITGEDGLLAGANDGLLVIDCGTSLPGSTLKLGEQLQQANCALMDVPLGRSSEAAEAGMLNMMAGGSDTDFERAKPLLQTMSENLFHLGPLGSGHKIKLLNNACSVSMAIMIAEVVQTAKAADIDVKLLADVMTSGPLGSDFMKWMFEGPLSGDETKLQFSIKNATKDIGYFTAMADELNKSASVPSAAMQSITKVVEQGNGEDFMPALCRHL